MYINYLDHYYEDSFLGSGTKTIKERMKGLKDLRMKDDRMLKFVLFSQTESNASAVGVGKYRKERLKGNEKGV